MSLVDFPSGPPESNAYGPAPREPGEKSLWKAESRLIVVGNQLCTQQNVEERDLGYYQVHIL